MVLDARLATEDPQPYPLRYVEEAEEVREEHSSDMTDRSLQLDDGV